MMEEVGFQEVETYISRCHNTVAQLIFYQAYYLLVSGSGEAYRVTGVQAVVGVGRSGLGSIDGNYPFSVTKTLW